VAKSHDGIHRREATSRTPKRRAVFNAMRDRLQGEVFHHGGGPAVIIHGATALVFPNLHSRAYYALNQSAC
jgi:hypothetical protein